jgi:AcrR family transcriptional regulator
LEVLPMQARRGTATAAPALPGVRAVRPSSEEIDERILDVAAGVFARFGYAQASVQRIADEAGYSKTGLLHRFGSKEQLRDAARERCLATFAEAIDSAHTRTPGPARDRDVVAALIDLAMRRPGFIALLLSGGTQPRTEDTAWVHQEARALLDSGFGMDDTTPLSRRMRVLGCLGALGLGVVLTQEYPAHEVRAELEATCCAALGL